MRHLINFLLVVILFWGCKKEDSTPVTPVQDSPTVRIVNPQNNQIIVDSTTIEIEAIDKKGITNVELYIDNKMVNNFYVKPYNYLWNVSSLPDSSLHSIYAIAYNSDKKSTGSEVVTVTTVGYVPVLPKGALFVQSTPSNAQIFVNGNNSGKVTPYTVKNLDSGLVKITLKLTGYSDTTFSRQILPNMTSSVFIQMSQPPIYEVSFSNVRLYEQASSNFQGIKLSTGIRVNSNSVDADIFLQTTELKSQDQRTPAVSNPNVTYFDSSPGSTNLIDGIASNTFNASAWVKGKARSATTYSFLYTKSGNYVKLRCTSYGGATSPTDPDRWVEVSYKYNQIVGDKRFKTN